MITTERLLNFTLPPELEAREPAEARGLRRDQVRLLVSYARDDRIVHARFTDLPDFLRSGDLVVANDSATLPAALSAWRDGHAIALHLSTRLPGQLWVVEPRETEATPGDVFGKLTTRLRPGLRRRPEPSERAGSSAGQGTLVLPGGGSAELLAPYADSTRLWVARLGLPAPVLDYLHQWGRPISYPYVRGVWPLEMYQTVYANEPGSAEMPSAGRAFTPDVLERLAHQGTAFATLTLHTGVASLEAHEAPYDEQYSVSPRTADAVRAARENGGRVIAVGTTVVRALESAADEHGRVIASRGWTDLVITPERGVRVVDGLLTGLHEPRASHLAMLEAIGGRSHLEKVYRAALDAGYLWHEFGDLHLMLPT